jgi:hypothetical protein
VAEPHDHAIGRSRGGFTTKIRLAADGGCRPLVFVLTGGQVGDAPTFMADKAYSSRAIRDHLSRRGIRAVIPVPTDQRGHRLRRGSRGGRPPAFDRETYKPRDL